MGGGGGGGGGAWCDTNSHVCCQTQASVSLSSRYDPKTNTWTPVVAMNSRRSGVGLSVVCRKLVVVGGFDGCTYLKSVEWFDQSLNQWKQAGHMNYRRLGCGVGVLPLTNPT